MVARPEVFVQPFPSGLGRWTVSVEGGASPRWSPKGDELFFLYGNTLMVSSTEAAGAFRATRPAPLIDGDSAGVWFYSFTPQIPSYDVGLDGRTFVVVRPSGGGENEIMLVQNWSAPFTK